MEQKTTTFNPAWVEEMQKWQNENNGQRAVLCVTSDESGQGCTLYGKAPPIVAALIEFMGKNTAIKDLISDVKEISENPIARMILLSAWEDYKKEHGIKNADVED